MVSPAPGLDPERSLGQYIRDEWRIEAGLPHLSIHSLTQSPEAYLWVGTEEGVARFDGRRFVVHNRRNTPDLDSDRIMALTVGPGGTVWVGCYGGGVARWNAGVWGTLPQTDRLAETRIRCLLTDPAGRLWIGTEDGLSVTENGPAALESRTTHLAGLQVLCLALDPAGTVWAGTSGNGLFRRLDDGFTPVPLPGPAANTSVYTVLTGPAGEIWVGTEAGLVRLPAEGPARLIVPDDPGAHRRVNALVQDGHGTLWVGTEGGLYRLRGGTLETSPAGDPLGTHAIRSLHEDADGNLWVGSFRAGLIRLRDGPLHTLTTRDGLPDNDCWTVLEDTAGRLWVGTGNGLAVRETGRWRVITTRDGLPHPVVTALGELPDGQVWAGTDGGGVFRVAGGSPVRYDTRQGLAHNHVFSLLGDRTGALWAGTNGGGLTIWRDGRPTVLTSADGLAGNRVNTLLEDSRGDIWIGTSSGLNRWSAGRLLAVDRTSGLHTDIVLSLMEDQTGHLWVGTLGGGLFRHREGRFSGCGTRHGLPDDTVYRVLEDPRGDFWISGNRGLYRVPRAELEAVCEGRATTLTGTLFTDQDGMGSPESNGGVWPSGWRSRTGQMYFPGPAGLVVVPTELPGPAPHPPPVLIETLTLDGREPLPVYRAEAGGIALPPGRRRLSFDFTAPGQVAPERVGFRFRLRGFDPDWTDAGAERTAHYTNLPPGEYQFEVLARGPDGVWGAPGARVDFRIAPLFWQTAWFSGLVGVAGLVVLFLLVRLREARLRLRTNQLEALVEARTLDLQNKNRELEQSRQTLERLARTDELTGLLNRREMMHLLTQEGHRVERHPIPFTILLGDIDNFKQINDRYGHAHGDRVLVQFARRLTDGLRQVDRIARWGGEEFLVLLPGTDLAGGRVAGEKLRARVAGAPFHHQGLDLPVTVTFGTAEHRPGQAIDETVRAADEALYRGKRLGRNRVEVAGDESGSPGGPAASEPNGPSVRRDL